ncbi:hypothetical protein [Kutzneria buriramensis]|nr:hypothetical protein [Kutzneria buriramensis]
MRSSTTPGDDPVAQARGLVDRTLTALLRPDITDEQEHAAAETFLDTCTPQFLAALTGSAEDTNGRLVPVAEAMAAAAGHFRAVQVLDARSELVAARGSLVALDPAPAPATTTETCDVCERESPCWAFPIRGATILLDLGTAKAAMLLVCDGCRTLVQESRSDAELAQRAGRPDVLPRSLRDLRARLLGEAAAWPGQAE